MEEGGKNDELQTLIAKKRRKNKKVVNPAWDKKELEVVGHQEKEKGVEHGKIELPTLDYWETILEANNSTLVLEQPLLESKPEKEAQ